MASKPLSADAISLIREELEERRVHFFAQHSEKPLIRAAIKKDWNGRGDYTRSYGQSIVLFAMRACVLNEQIDEANAALQELCQYHLDRPQTFLEIHSFPSFTRSLAALYLYYGLGAPRHRIVCRPKQLPLWSKPCGSGLIKIQD